MFDWLASMPTLSHNKLHVQCASVGILFWYREPIKYICPIFIQNGSISKWDRVFRLLSLCFFFYLKPKFGHKSYPKGKLLLLLLLFPLTFCGGGGGGCIDVMILLLIAAMQKIKGLRQSVNVLVQNFDRIKWKTSIKSQYFGWRLLPISWIRNYWIWTICCKHVKCKQFYQFNCSSYAKSIAIWMVWFD